MSGPAFRVHGLADARAVLAAAAALDRPVTLVSGPAAAGYGGAAWFQALAEAAARHVPEARFIAVLDCGHGPGFVLGALRQGLKHLLFQGDRETAARLADLVRRHGAELWTEPPDALDLAACDDPARAARAWLAGTRA